MNGEMKLLIFYIEFMKAGVRGLTLIYASGDFGAFSDNFYNRTAFTPSYPASSMCNVKRQDQGGYGRRMT